MAVVQFDVDGVLADFIAGFYRLGVRTGAIAPWAVVFDSCPPSDATNLKYGTTHMVGHAVSDAVWKHILDSPEFWRTLPSAVHRDTWRRINDMQDAHTVYFATNRMGRHPKWQTAAWLQAHGIHMPTVVVTARKGEFARTVGATHSIEDKAGNAVYIAYESPGTSSYLIDRPYNRFDHDVLGSKVQRVTTVEQFLDAIDQGV